MKRETRVLYTAHAGGWWVGIVARGPGLDGVVVARSCASLCIKLLDRGFMGELRYAEGPCSCGLPEPPARPVGQSFKYLAEAVARAMGRLAGLAGDP